MECSCAINIDSDGDTASLFKSKIVTARKEHQCCECHRKIMLGEEYENVNGKWDFGFETDKTCLDCVSLRDVFFESWIYTQVWENFQDDFGYTDSVIPESCIAALTPGASAKVCELIELSWEN